MLLRPGITKNVREQGMNENNSRVRYKARNKSVTTSSYPFSLLFNYRYTVTFTSVKDYFKQFVKQSGLTIFHGFSSIHLD